MKPATEEGGAPVSTVPAMIPSSQDSTKLVSSILRLVAVVLTLLAAIVMGTAKETVIVDVSSDYIVEGKANSTYNSSFVYLIVVNVLACVYSGVSAGITLAKQSGSSRFKGPLMAALDLLFTILLFTGMASAAAVEIVAQKGNSHFGWSKICGYADKFCAHLTASIVLSTVASVLYALILLISLTSHRPPPL